MSTAPCTLLTSDIFTALAPSPTNPPYSYSNLCTAIATWNTDNPSNQIFMGATDDIRKNELAAFLGHTLHESDNYVAPREYSQCQTNVDVSGTLYCQPDGYTAGDGSRLDPYCSTTHTTSSDPNGCNCAAVAENNPNGYEANKLFFGRGPIQLSWNYNYIDAGAALGVNLCDNPELVATDSTIAWGTAIWFWMQNTGATGTTCHTAITSNNSFGQSLNTINGGLECTTSTGARSSVVSRLDDYCRASKEFGVALLDFGGCTDLQTVYDSCITGGSQTWGACANCDATPSPTASPTTASPTASPTTASPTTASPTGKPTTASPTKKPTPSPTRSPTPFDFYPDWEGQDEGCVADGNEPLYIARNPAYRFTDRESCCKTYYDWMYDKCMNGNNAVTPSTGLYFPDWESGSSDQTCKIDEGDVPEYMAANPSGWMYDTMDSCCKKWFSWKYDDCIGSDPASPPTPSVTTGLWYPNWEGGTNVCLNDENQPAYMSNSPNTYMHDTLQDCCDWNYRWALNECLGDQAPPGTAKWYINWTEAACVKDCATGNDCGGLAMPWDILYDSKEQCCDSRMWWDDDCIST